MKTNLSKTEARAKIDNFFKKSDIDKEQLKKIRRLAMKFNIKLKEHKKTFCKACLSPLKGQIRLTKTHKTIICAVCNFRNRFKLKLS